MARKRVWLIICAGLLASSAVHAGSLRICARNLDPDDWKGLWHWGAITIPAGTAFDELEPDGQIDPAWHSTSGVVTTSAVRISQSHPCATAKASAAILPDLRWTTSTIFGNDKPSYYIYGMFEGSDLKTSFGPLGAPPSNGLQAAIELYDNDVVGTVIGTLTQSVSLSDGTD
jgi:hypothetical protein